MFISSTAGIWYIMWANIGKVAEHKDSMEFGISPRRSIDSGTGKMVNDGLFLFADCRSAIKGTFLGESPGWNNTRNFFRQGKANGWAFLDV